MCVELAKHYISDDAGVICFFVFLLAVTLTKTRITSSVSLVVYANEHEYFVKLPVYPRPKSGPLF